MALLELSRGQPPKTSCAATGGGGVHLYFRYPSVQELRAAGLYTQQVRNSQGLLGDGLDVRGEKGRVRRLRSGPAEQHGASLPVDRSGASRRCLLAARLLEGGRVRRDAVLMGDRLLRQSGFRGTFTAFCGGIEPLGIAPACVPTPRIRDGGSEPKIDGGPGGHRNRISGSDPTQHSHKGVPVRDFSEHCGYRRRTLAERSNP